MSRAEDEINLRSEGGEVFVIPESTGRGGAAEEFGSRSGGVELNGGSGDLRGILVAPKAGHAGGVGEAGGADETVVVPSFAEGIGRADEGIVERVSCEEVGNVGVGGA